MQTLNKKVIGRSLIVLAVIPVLASLFFRYYLGILHVGTPAQMFLTMLVAIPLLVISFWTGVWMNGTAKERL